MILNKKNEIDKKIGKTFPKDVIENVTKDTIEYFGINFNSDVNEDISFKIYYDNMYCRKQYKKFNNDPLTNYLIEKDMLNYLQAVYDEDNNNFLRCELGIKFQTNQNMEKLFEWLDKNIKFFNKYRDEIIKISKMRRFPSKKYSSLYFIGFVKENSEIKVFKCHWYNTIKKGDALFKNSYFLNYIQRMNISAFNDIIPYTKQALKKCKGKLCMEGIDYNEETAEKHKIYLLCSIPPYDGLIQTFSDNEELIRKITIIKEWNAVHPEFYCPGFAIGKDTKNNLTLNLYFSFNK